MCDIVLDYGGFGGLSCCVCLMGWALFGFCVFAFCAPVLINLLLLLNYVGYFCV